MRRGDGKTVDPTIVVVGAAGGIGLEIVRQLEPRARVLAVVQTEEQIAPARTGGATKCVVCDIADSDAVKRAIEILLEESEGQLSGLIISAAMQPVGAVEAVTRPELERLFSVNVFGAFELLQGLLPEIRSNRGRIVLFSSMAGRVAPPLLGAYASTKFAVEALADALRRELKDVGVSVSLIEPGGVDTPMAAAQGDLAERGLASLNGALREVYGPLYRGYRAMTAKALKYASPPTAVASLACDAALGDRHPKARYVAGLDAKLMLGLARWLPTRWMDALLIRANKQN